MYEERANDAAVMFPYRYVVQDANGYFHGSTQEISLVMAVCLLVYYILMFTAYVLYYNYTCQCLSVFGRIYQKKQDEKM